MASATEDGNQRDDARETPRLKTTDIAVGTNAAQLVGALVVHLARTGVLSLEAFEDHLRSDFDPGLTKVAPGGASYADLAAVIENHRRGGALP